MNKTLMIVIALVVLAGGGWLLYQNSSPDNKAANQPAANTTPAASSSTATDSAKSTETGNITMKNNIFSPPQISVSKGATVTWTNNDTVAHNVTDDLENVGGPKSETIEPGGTYSFTFEKTGSFQYHCTIHPSMRGTIVVK